MRTEDEIVRKGSSCFATSNEKSYEQSGLSEAEYYSGAYHALLWVLEEIEEI